MSVQAPGEGPPKVHRKKVPLQMSQMNGEFLTLLRQPLHSELASSVVGHNAATKHHLKRHLDQWYKEHNISLSKITRAQDKVYKTMLQAHIEKRKLPQRHLEMVQELKRIQPLAKKMEDSGVKMKKPKALDERGKDVHNTELSEQDDENSLNKDVCSHLEHVKPDIEESVQELDKKNKDNSGLSRENERREALKTNIHSKEKKGGGQSAHVMVVSHKNAEGFVPVVKERSFIDENEKGVYIASAVMEDIQKSNMEQLPDLQPTESMKKKKKKKKKMLDKPTSEEHTKTTKKDAMPMKMKKASLSSILPSIDEHCEQPNHFEEFNQTRLENGVGSNHADHQMAGWSNQSSTESLLSTEQRFRENAPARIIKRYDRLTNEDTVKNREPSRVIAPLETGESLAQYNRRIRRDREKRRRNILNKEELIIYKRTLGGYIPDDLPFRRRQFSLPTNREARIRERLLHAQYDAIEQQRHKMDNFFFSIESQGILQKMPDPETKKTNKPVNIEMPTTHRSSIPKSPVKSNYLDAYMKAFRQAPDLPEHIDPSSIEAIQHTRYIRTYTPPGLRKMDKNEKLSSWSSAS